MRSMSSSIGPWTFGCCTATMPHISGRLRCDHGESALFRVEATDLEASLGTPRAYLGLGLAVRVLRPVPVEVDVEVLLERITVVPEELREVPVDEALHVVAAALDAKSRNVFDIDRRLQCREVARELGQRPHRLPGLVVRHRREHATDVVIGELSHGSLLPVDVEKELASRSEEPRTREERGERGRLVVKDALGEDRVERAWRERHPQRICLDEV